jgi:hypothetical protein
MQRSKVRSQNYNSKPFNYLCFVRRVIVARRRSALVIPGIDAPGFVDKIGE